jgi:hypothetical protein
MKKITTALIGISIAASLYSVDFGAAKDRKIDTTSTATQAVEEHPEVKGYDLKTFDKESFKKTLNIIPGENGYLAEINVHFPDLTSLLVAYPAIREAFNAQKIYEFVVNATFDSMNFRGKETNLFGSSRFSPAVGHVSMENVVIDCDGKTMKRYQLDIRRATFKNCTFIIGESNELTGNGMRVFENSSGVVQMQKGTFNPALRNSPGLRVEYPKKKSLF